MPCKKVKSENSGDYQCLGREGDSRCGGTNYLELHLVRNLRYGLHQLKDVRMKLGGNLEVRLVVEEIDAGMHYIYGDLLLGD